MRKLLTAVMAVTMTVSLAACSGKNALKTDSFPVASTVQTVQSEQKKVYTGKTGTIAMALTTGTSEEDGMEKDVMSYICGGYEINQGSTMIEDNPEEKVAFEKATECLAGATFEPVAYLGKQIVAGTNYSFLCRMTPSYPGSEGSFVIVIVYEDLEGNAEISAVEDIDISASEGVEEETEQETEPEYGIFEGESASVQMANPWSAYEKIEDAVEASGVSFKIPEELNGERYLLSRP